MQTTFKHTGIISNGPCDKANIRFDLLLTWRIYIRVYRAMYCVAGKMYFIPLGTFLHSLVFSAQFLHSSSDENFCCLALVKWHSSGFKIEFKGI